MSSSEEEEEEEDEQEEARAVNTLALRLQPMLAEGRVAEVQTILLRALTQRETRERALNLLDYLTNENGETLLTHPTVRPPHPSW